MKRLIVVLSVMAALIVMSCGKKSASDGPIPSESRQMILVLTDSVQSTLGFLYRLERAGASTQWRSLDDPVQISIGRTGLAWGRGLHPLKEGMSPVKREGDGKSPAGIFHVTSLFGFYPEEKMAHLNMPYQHITEMLECVDDAQSPHYNRLLNRDEADVVDWNSSEKMIQYETCYELGAVVEHNMDPVELGGGSCIFIHVWSRPGGPTAGCTAMTLENMTELSLWLDESKSPVLVQLTGDWYTRYLKPWNLPDLFKE